MKNILKRALATFLVVAIVLCSAPLSGLVGLELPDWLDFSIESNAATYSGTCGENVTWNLDTSTGVFTISGTGDMTNYSSSSSAPWYYYTSSITSVSIGDSVTSIGEHAFYNCTSLTSVTIGDGVKSIGEYAFYYCISLTSITVDNNNPYYSSDEYGVLFNKDKTTLIQYPIGNTRKSYTIPDSVTSIGDWAFALCDSLTNVEIGNGVTSLELFAFAGCANLVSVKIGSGLKTIAETFGAVDGFLILYGVFCYSPKLEKIIVDENNEYFSSDANGILYNKDKTTLILCPEGKTEISYKISENTKTIADYAFAGCQYLQSVPIGENVTTIGEWAFGNCFALTSVDIPDSVESIESAAFVYCSKLENVNIGSGVKKIANNYAYDLEEYSYSPFLVCEALEKITVDESNEYYSSDSSGVLFNKDKTKLITYPSGKKDTIYIIPHTVKSIEMYAFFLINYVECIHIPSSVTNIEYNLIYSICSDTEDCYAKTFADENGIDFRVCTEHTHTHEYVTFSHYEVEHPHYAVYECSCGATEIKESETTEIDTCEICNPPHVCDYDTFVKYQEAHPHYAVYKCDCGATKVDTSKTTTVDTCEICNPPHVCKYDTFAKYQEAHPHYAVYKCECGNTKVDTTKTTTVDTCEICNPPHTHTPKVICIEPTCTVNGMEYTVCKECGETLGDTTILPAGHIWSDWVVVTEATNTTDGLERRECVNCDAFEENVIPKLAEVIRDDKSGVELLVPSGAYSEDIKLEIEEVFDGASFNIVNTLDNVSNTTIFDIKTTVNGVEIQPNTTLTVRIPLPEGYDPEFTFVYHINSNTGEIEEMNARYEDGYLVFETTHFSHYAVVEIGQENYSISIQAPSRTTIRCKDGIVLHANVEGTLPEGAKIVWSASNNKFKTKNVGDSSFQIVSNNNGYTTFTATLVDADGNVLATDTVEMYSKAGFGDKIGGFFRSLFGATKIYDK